MRCTRTRVTWGQASYGALHEDVHHTGVSHGDKSYTRTRVALGRALHEDTPHTGVLHEETRCARTRLTQGHALHEDVPVTGVGHGACTSYQPLV